eukprot:CAMPEP_0184648484 /NCGR_PEP_ID=MMETSP0308-20130426/5606_1 /TAXON_ID=38269 /ORGANISM="Gloeochaete witrockiana, Strain SAG 46.84" /LENGTH=265 /DNA_ID=CAMNT_0027080339 /DNA_START=88 /DNA_END=885 /DNA_ORIENTATION=+
MKALVDVSPRLQEYTGNDLLSFDEPLEEIIRRNFRYPPPNVSFTTLVNDGLSAQIELSNKLMLANKIGGLDEDKSVKFMTFNDRYNENLQKDDPTIRNALMFLADAQSALRRGDQSKATDLYKRSIQAHPTADAHTFLGWMYSMTGRKKEAITECYTALQLDTDFGNPYNDLGVYMREEGDLEQAMEWFEKAKRAPRYNERHFPHLNLAHLHWQQGRIQKALEELLWAVRRATQDEDRVALRHMVTQAIEKFKIKDLHQPPSKGK